jgi:hypothetical protein
MSKKLQIRSEAYAQGPILRKGVITIFISDG